MSVVPLGFNRVSVPFQMNRAYNSLQSAQSLLSYYNNQLLTQRQYQYGSDAPYNASTSLSVQALMERKAQNASNLKTTQTFLTASDSTLSQISPLTDDVRSMALSAIETTTSDSERSVLAQTVGQSLQQILNFGNYSFQGRYAFTGSTTSVMPFEQTSSNTIVYRGTDWDVYSWSDTDLLSQSNMNGVDVFGAISDPVRGSVDLDPSVSGDTLLKNLNGGNGVEKGSIRLTYTTGGHVSTYDVDLSRCSSLADVERTLEEIKSPHFTLQVDLTENNLVLSLPTGTPGTLVVSEIGKGTIARQLGIPTGKEFDPENPLVGRDLDPALVPSTRLSDILGSKAERTLRFAGENNDIVVRAMHNGETYTDAEGNEFPLNDVAIDLFADTNLSQGEAVVEYDPAAKRIVVRIHPDTTSADRIMEAINKASGDGTIPPFEASPSTLDSQSPALAGTGVVSLLPGTWFYGGTTEGGTGVDFDKSGLEIVNGNETHTISFQDCRTIGDVLAELNDPRYGLYATVNESGTGIDIRSRVSGTDFCIGENGGTTAAQLGVRTLNSETRLDELDFGRGIDRAEIPGTKATAQYSGVSPNSDLILRAKNTGTEWNDYQLNFVPTDDPQGKVVVSVDVESKVVNIGINPGVTTACEVIEAFNTQPGPKQYFELELDDSTGSVNTGEGVVYDGFARTSGGTNDGIDFTITRNDGKVLDIGVRKAETLQDVIDLINGHEDNKDGLLVASLSEFGNGIELTDRSIGNSTTRVDRTLLSTNAITLGLIEPGEEFRTTTAPGTQAHATVGSGVLNGSLLVTAKQVGTYAEGVGVEFVEGTVPGFVWDTTNRVLRFTIQPGVTTANDIVAFFQNSAPEEVRSMFDIQNGTNPDGLPSDGSGPVEAGRWDMTGGSDNRLEGNDPNPKETESLFNALIRLKTAMENNDTREIERATRLLDDSVQRVSDARAMIGVMQNSLDNTQERLSEEYVQHESTLNNTLRIDFADASISYMAQQVSYQASLQVASAMFQMSLLNFI